MTRAWPAETCSVAAMVLVLAWGAETVAQSDTSDRAEGTPDAPPALVPPAAENAPPESPVGSPAEPSAGTAGSAAADATPAPYDHAWVETLLAAGRVAFESGRFEDALGRLQEAYGLSHRPDLLYHIGLLHDRLGHRDDALLAFEQYLVEVPAAENRAEVEARIVAIRSAAPGTVPTAPAAPGSIAVTPSTPASGSVHVAAAADGLALHRRVGASLGLENYAFLCSLPCDAALGEGEIDLAVSRGTGDPLAAGTVSVRPGAGLRARYEDRGLWRDVGLGAMIGGFGLALVTISVGLFLPHTDARGREQYNFEALGVGTAFMSVGLGGFLVWMLLHDSASVQVE